MSLPLQNKEALRQQNLRSYRILDTPAEESFDELARLAQQLCRTQFAFITFMDGERQWNKSCLGMEIREVRRDLSICTAAVERNELVVVEDASAHENFRTHPMVTGGPKVRFFAAMPVSPAVTTAPGKPPEEEVAIGTICVADTHPRTLSPEEASALKTLARQVIALLELRRNYADLYARHEETQVALKHSEAFFHSLVETLPQNIFRKDLNGRFTFGNSRFCATVKRTLEEVIGKTDFDFFPAELAAKYQEDDHKVLSTGQPLKVIEKHQDQDGNTLYVQVIKTALTDWDGKICGLQGIFWDETDRHKAEEALAYERALFRAMLDNIPDSIYFKDRESRFIAISRSLATRLGLENPDEGRGKTDRDFFDSAHAEEALRDEKYIVETGLPVVAKTEKEIWKDGGVRWVLTTKVPLKNREGQIIGTFGISKDITELKDTEAELAKARDAALESARLKSEFLANMSHEIRTPLNAVIGMTGLLMDTELNEEQRDFADTIRSSADSLLNIINDILDFSKIEAGKLAIEIIDFDLSEVVEGTAEILAEAAQAKGIELATWIDEKTARHLRGDPGRLRQVLTNLLSNAVKFTEQGEVVLHVTTVEDTQKTAVLRFSVKDTGIGIPYEAQNRIFQAFTQADGSTTRRYGGTGLGLSISKQLVELMHGQVGFESHPGKGSIFWFSVPLEKRDEQRVASAMASTLQGIRVLVVDDNETNREIVHRQVLSWRMRNGVAESGAQALELLREAVAARDPYQLVILDMQMPNMDGLTLAATIKRDPVLHHTQLLMLTSLGHLPEERTWRECGISAYLIKPVKESRLYDTIVTVMRGARESLRPDRPLAPAVPGGETISRRSMRVLVAEDNMVNQKVALRQLQKLGYSADAVANGLEVIRAMKRIPYDIILMDCQMPELDGYEATRRIRAEEKAKRAPWQHYIVAMTANALAGDREECIAAGMNDYITKPVRIDELDSALMRGLETITVQKERSASPPTIDPTVLDSLRELRMEGEPDPLAELVDLFLSDTPARISRIEQAFATNNAHDLESAAHSLKGSASNLGAAALAKYCASIVHAVRRGERPDATILTKIQEEFKTVTPLLLEAKNS